MRGRFFHIHPSSTFVHALDRRKLRRAYSIIQALVPLFVLGLPVAAAWSNTVSDGSRKITGNRLRLQMKTLKIFETGSKRSDFLILQEKTWVSTGVIFSRKYKKKSHYWNCHQSIRRVENTPNMIYAKKKKRKKKDWEGKKGTVLFAYCSFQTLNSDH